MGNILETIKRFISNKNTVTILAVIAGVIILWYFYNYRVNQAITTIRIPYAINNVDTAKKIESDNIGYKEITASTVKDSDIITDSSYLEGKYICYGTSVPANGFFYQSQICEHEELNNSVLENLPDGYALYPLDVDSRATYANSILPGDYIDLYVQTRNEDGQVIFGSLIESIEVLAVRDSSGKDVFWDSEAGDTAILLFAVPEEYHELLNVAEMIGVQIKPIPRGANYTQNPGETSISSQQLYNYIMRHKVTIVN